jgi:glycosyltransferase involved in cell wall biosynthesis
MKVAFINNSAETFTPTQSGAIATHIWECCRAARNSGFDPLVISIRCAAEPYREVRTVLLDYPRLPTHPALTKALRAQRKLTGWRHLRQGNYAGRVAKAVSMAGMGTGTLILHNDPEMAVVLREKFPKAFIVHHFHNLLECRPRFRDRFKGAVNAITAVSDFTSRWVEDYYGCGKVTTIYNGVDTERFVPMERTDDDVPVINFTGRTGIEKAPDLLLHAACRLTEKTKAFAIQILGSNHWQKFEMDDYQRTLAGLSEELERKGVRVHRPGHVQRENLPRNLQNADIHVVPSRWDEPFGLVTAEGMACGLATVGSRTGGTPELIGDAGLLFERDSVEELAGHLYDLVTNRELRRDLGRKARARAQEFSWSRTWNSFSELGSTN